MTQFWSWLYSVSTSERAVFMPSKSDFVSSTDVCISDRVVLTASLSSTAFAFKPRPCANPSVKPLPNSMAALNTCGIYSPILEIISPADLANCSPRPCQPPSSNASLSFPNSFVPVCTMSRMAGVRELESEIFRPSDADCARVMSPARLSNWTFAICSAAPVEFLMAVVNF